MISRYLDNSSYDAEDGAALKDIEACRAISSTVQTYLGPYGDGIRPKTVIEHLEKTIFTSEAAAHYPSVVFLVTARQQQESAEMATASFVIVLDGRPENF